MLDLGLSKLAIIGVVALVVIGPERLPKVARTAGALLGRAQRYMNDVKAEVAREMDMSDLKAAKSQFEDAARNMHSSVSDNLRETEEHLNETWRTLSPDPVVGTAAADGLPIASDLNPSGYGVYEDGTQTAQAITDGGTTGGAASEAVLRDAAQESARRRNWRAKQAVRPVWFKRTQSVRTKLQSGAARVARDRGEHRAPIRFL